MTDKTTELIDKIGKMDLEEVDAYHRVVKMVSLFFTVCGVSLLTVMLVFTAWFTVLPGMILVYMLANMSAGSSEVLRATTARIKKLS
jgi:hypothetical protein